MKDGSGNPLKSGSAAVDGTFGDKPALKSRQDCSSENCYVLKNKNGMSVAISRNNGRIVKLFAPNSAGSMVNVISDTSAENSIAHPAVDKKLLFLEGVFGCLDIDRAQFIAYPENKVYGIEWAVTTPNSHELSFTCNMAAGCADHVCMIKINIHYFLSADNVINVLYGISTDKKMICNSPAALLFNLNGAGSGSVLRHQVSINAGEFVCIDPFLMFAGGIKDVKGTPFDFRKSATIGSRIFDNDVQLKNADGYNHSFILNKHSHKTAIARVKGDKTGIVLEVYTDQPALKFHTCSCVVNGNAPSPLILDKYSSFAFRAGSLPVEGNIVQPQLVTLFSGGVNKMHIKYRFARY